MSSKGSPPMESAIEPWKSEGFMQGSPGILTFLNTTSCASSRGAGGSSNSAKESLSSNMTRESKWTQERKREDSGYNINKTIVSDRSTAGPAEQRLLTQIGA